MENFWDYSVWGTLNVVAVLLASLLVGNILKKSVGFLKNSLIPISVIGG
jgi:Na+/glutamate symporter